MPDTLYTPRMDETERPKPPRRRKNGDPASDATSEAGAAAKPARRRAAPKPAAEGTEPPTPKPRTRRTTRSTADDGSAEVVPAEAAPKSPSRARAPRTRKAAAGAATDPAPAQAAIALEQEPAAGPATDTPAYAPTTRDDRIAASSPAPTAVTPPIAVVVSGAASQRPPAPAMADREAPARIPSFARGPARSAHARTGWSGQESWFRKLAAPARAGIRRIAEMLQKRHDGGADGLSRPAAPARPADTSKRSGQVLDWLLERLPPQHRRRAHDYLVLMRMDRPVGALLLLWPTWWALWFAANDFPPPGLLVVFTLGVFVMRSAGCVINDYADHGWLDANVERTAGRPMAAGRVSKKEAMALFGGLLALAFVLVLFTNALTIKLSFVGAALAAVYPFTKRVTHLAQVVLGAAFGWSIPMAFAAVTHSLPPLCWLLFLANILFSVVYDTEYAMVDRDEDVRAGAKSTAILFGDADRAIVGVLMATFVFAMLLAGTRAHLHWPYFLGLAVAAGLLGWQQWLIRDRDRPACFAAFRNNNWVGFAIWLGLLFALAIR